MHQEFLLFGNGCQFLYSLRTGTALQIQNWFGTLNNNSRGATIVGVELKLMQISRLSFNAFFAAQFLTPICSHITVLQNAEQCSHKVRCWVTRCYQVRCLSSFSSQVDGIGPFFWFDQQLFLTLIEINYEI